MDQGLRGRQRRRRSGRRLFRQGADRQGHVGDDRADGRHGRAEDRPAEGRRHHRVGAVADRRHSARDALPPGRRLRGAEGARGQDPHHDRRAADHPAGQGAGVGAGGDPRGGRQQLPVDPGLRRALDRRRRRLLEGARHPRRRADGGPRHSAHLQPAAGELVAPRRHHRRRREGEPAPDGRGGRRAERSRSGVPADGPRPRRQHRVRRPRRS